MAKKILIIEDELDILEIVTFRMKKSGYEILEAVDGQAGLDAIHREKPDLILLDLHLPVISGEDICMQVKKDDSLKDIPVILFTATGANTVRIEEKIKKLGANDYIIKPFNYEELLEKVEKYLK